MSLEDLKQIYDDKEAKTVAENKHLEMINSQKVVSDTIIESISSLIKYLEGKVTKTEVQNQIENFATTEDALKIVSAIILLQKQVRDSQTDITPLLVGLNAVKEQIKSIPETKFEQKDSFKVNNLDEIKFDTTKLEKAIKDKNLEVNVEAPIIHTEKTDTKLVESILNDILSAVKKQKLELPKEFKVSNLGEIAPTDTSTLEKEQKKQTKLLKEIADKPVSRGGGGGIVSYVNSAGLATPVTLNASGKVPVSLGSDKINVNIDMATAGIATEATLALIKNTDGIKKITDALPAGDNNIGNVDIVTMPVVTNTPTFPSFQQVSLAVTATSGSVSFSQPVKSVLIENTGASDAYINFGSAATTAHYRLSPYESMSLELTFTALHAICDATKTTTLRAIGLF